MPVVVRKGVLILSVLNVLQSSVIVIDDALTTSAFLQGMDVVRRVEDNPTDGRDKPTKEVVIEDCGHEVISSPFSVTKDDATE